MKKIILLVLITAQLICFTGIALAVHRNPTTWVPTSGQVSAWDSAAYPNSVFLFRDFSWSSLQRLQGLREDSNETLEIDCVIYN